MKVEPPPFDPGPPAVRHYLVTILTASDDGLLALLQGAGFGAEVAAGTASHENGVFHNLLDTTVNGVYEAVFKTKEMGPTRDGIVRLWWQMPADAVRGDPHHVGGHVEGPVRPIALDLHTRGGTHLAAEGQGSFSHLWTEDHPPLPGIAGHTAGLAYEGFDRVLTLGPRPDVVLEEAWAHVSRRGPRRAPPRPRALLGAARAAPPPAARRRAGRPDRAAAPCSSSPTVWPSGLSTKARRQRPSRNGGIRTLPP